MKSELGQALETNFYTMNKDTLQCQGVFLFYSYYIIDKNESGLSREGSKLNGVS